MPRTRAVKVCESCHSQKIRCDVDSTGTPCSKCTQIGEGCMIRTRKQYRSEKRARRSSTSSRTTGSDNYGDRVATSVPPASLLCPDLVRIVEAAVEEPTSRIVPIFVGEGGYSTILDVAEETANRHFYVPTTTEKALAAEDLEYLKIKGCFTLPAESEQLINSYFRFVHPTFPVIDEAAFLRSYATNGLEGINLLLLWCMFSVSASYIPNSPRKARKETYMHRAKLLFDLGSENDKVVLVQSALLLSFWFVDVEDVKQSWYWTGIAFSIAQTLGLHRNITGSTLIDVQQRALWRNIWQCCMIRDVWLAFSMGRPLRINASERDLPTPNGADCLFADLVLHSETLYSSIEAAEFVSMWQSLIAISNFLREIITTGKLSLSQVKFFEDRINVRSSSSSTFLLTHVDRHLKLHQYAAMMALARGSGLKENLEKAADNTTAIVGAFLDDDAAVYAAPITIPLLVPAMVTYLTTSNSHSSNAKKLAKEKLLIYSRFLITISDNYPAASIVNRVFAAAQQAISRKDANQNDEVDAQPDVMTLDQVSTSLDWSWLWHKDLPVAMEPWSQQVKASYSFR